MPITAAERTKIVEITVAMFGAAPGAYLADLVSLYENVGKNDKAFAIALANSNEFKAPGFFPPYLTAEEVATKMTQSFGLDPNDNGAGKKAYDFFLSNLQGAQDVYAKVGELYAQAVDYLNNVAKADPANEFNAAAKALENKTIVAEYYSTHEGATVTDIAALQKPIANVNENTDVTNPADVINQAGGVVTDQAFTLTTNADIINGTAADENFTAPVVFVAQAGGQVDTLNSTDVIDGGAGNDSLTVFTQGGAGAFPSMTNVETLKVKAFGAINWNMANVTGLQKVVNDASVANVTMTNLANIVELEDKNTVTGAGLSASYIAAAVSGLTDEQKITLENAGSTAGRESVVLYGGNIEKVSITANGSDNRADLQTQGTEELVITGAGKLNLTVTDNNGTAAGVGNNIKNINAADATGDLNLDLSNYSATTQALGAVNQTITLGSGDDRLTVDNFDDKDTVDTGTGDDRVTVEARAANEHTASKALTIKNAETVAFHVDVDNNTNNEAYIYNLAGVDSIQTLAIDAPLGGGDTVTLNKVGDTLKTIAYNGQGATADTTFDTYTVNLNDTSGNQTLDITVTNKDQNGNLINGTKGTQLSGTLTANGIETINIKTDQLHPNSDNLQPANYDGGFALTLNADGLHTITVESPTFVDLSGAALDDQVKTVDATKADGGVKLDLTGVVDADTTSNPKVSVTTGKGDDTVLNLSPGNAADYTVKTGEGNDTVSLAANVNGKKLSVDLGAGNDSVDLSAENNIDANSQITVTTGAGVDTVIIDGGTADAVTITDFTTGAGGDKIDLNTNNATDGGGANAVNTTQYTEITNAPNNTALTAGLNVIDINNEVVSGNLTVANIISFLNDTNGDSAGTDKFTYNDAGDKVYVVVTNGADSALVLLDATSDTNGGADTTIGDDTAEVSILATLTGVSSPSDLVADNFTDFLA